MSVALLVDARGVDLGRASAGEAGGRGLDLVLAAAMAHHRAGELLLGGVFTTLTQGAHALEAEAERRIRSWPCTRPPPAARLSAGGRLSEWALGG